MQFEVFLRVLSRFHRLTCRCRREQEQGKGEVCAGGETSSPPSEEGRRRKHGLQLDRWINSEARRALFTFFRSRSAGPLSKRTHSIPLPPRKRQTTASVPALSFYHQSAHFDPLYALASERRAKSDPKSDPQAKRPSLSLFQKRGQQFFPRPSSSPSCDRAPPPRVDFPRLRALSRSPP